MTATGSSATATSAGDGRVVRHKPLDRALHWLTAAAVLTLLGTAFLPVLGVEFGWVPIHWAAGWALIALVLVHIVRALLWQDWRSVVIGPSDVAEAGQIAAQALRISGAVPARAGKYSFAQKFIHLAFAVVVLAACVTGGLMMVKIDTPWWDRNPYWLADATWGIVYVIHGLAALLLVTMVMVHAYFALRPEKKAYLRAMIAGWMTREEYERNHDPERWPTER